MDHPMAVQEHASGQEWERSRISCTIWLCLFRLKFSTPHSSYWGQRGLSCRGCLVFICVVNTPTCCALCLLSSLEICPCSFLRRNCDEGGVESTLSSTEYSWKWKFSQPPASSLMLLKNVSSCKHTWYISCRLEKLKKFLCFENKGTLKPKKVLNCVVTITKSPGTWHSKRERYQPMDTEGHT